MSFFFIKTDNEWQENLFSNLSKQKTEIKPFVMVGRKIDLLFSSFEICADSGEAQIRLVCDLIRLDTREKIKVSEL